MHRHERSVGIVKYLFIDPTNERPYTVLCVTSTANHVRPVLKQESCGPTDREKKIRRVDTCPAFAPANVHVPFNVLSRWITQWARC